MTQVEPFNEQRSELLLGEVRETDPQSLREDPSGVLGQLERDQESLLGRKPSKHIQLMLVAFVTDELHLEFTPGPGLPFLERIYATDDEVAGGLGWSGAFATPDARIPVGSAPCRESQAPERDVLNLISTRSFCDRSSA